MVDYTYVSEFVYNNLKFKIPIDNTVFSLNSLPNTDDSTPYHKFSVDREQR